MARTYGAVTCPERLKSAEDRIERRCVIAGNAAMGRTLEAEAVRHGYHRYGKTKVGEYTSDFIRRAMSAGAPGSLHDTADALERLRVLALANGYDNAEELVTALEEQGKDGGT